MTFGSRHDQETLIPDYFKQYLHLSSLVSVLLYHACVAPCASIGSCKRCLLQQTSFLILFSTAKPKYKSNLLRIVVTLQCANKPVPTLACAHSDFLFLSSLFWFVIVFFVHWPPSHAWAFELLKAVSSVLSASVLTALLLSIAQCVVRFSYS